MAGSERLAWGAQLGTLLNANRPQSLLASFTIRRSSVRDRSVAIVPLVLGHVGIGILIRETAQSEHIPGQFNYGRFTAESSAIVVGRIKNRIFPQRAGGTR